jgi:hypothetical protein
MEMEETARSRIGSGSTPESINLIAQHHNTNEQESER